MDRNRLESFDAASKDDGIRQLAGRLLVAGIVGAAFWLLLLRVELWVAVFLWQPLHGGPNSDFLALELSITAVPLVILVAGALSWWSGSDWLQQWAFFLGGMAACILVKAYWQSPGIVNIGVALKILARPLVLTCAVASLITFCAAPVIRRRLLANKIAQPQP